MTFIKSVLTCYLTLFSACILTRALTYIIIYHISNTILTEAVTYSLTSLPTNVVHTFCYAIGNLDVTCMAAVSVRCDTGMFSFGSIGFGPGTREAVYGSIDINSGLVFAVP